jgi:predicted PurR-regulated permease PerM
MAAPRARVIGRGTVFWIAMLGAVALLLWLLGSILPPFVLGMAVAYFLDPLVRRLERRGLSRAAAAGALVAGFSVVVATTLSLLVPVVLEQTILFVHKLPDLITSLSAALQPFLARTLAGMKATPAGDLTTPLVGTMQSAAAGATGLLSKVVGHALAVVNVVTLLAVTPLVAFYLLRDWPKIIHEIDGWLPLGHAKTIRSEFRQIDEVLAGFARGSLIVCASLGAFYAVALSILGLDFGLVIGLLAGIASFVPYLGFLIGIVSSMGIALYQFWPAWTRVAAVAAVFVVGQTLSDYVLVPRLVGDKVGLHPLWVIFGVFAGGALFGFVGMLVSVPTCAVIGVLARFAIAQYKNSELYRETAAR